MRSTAPTVGHGRVEIGYFFPALAVYSR